ncbi:MAG: hypothetical protein ACI8P3_003259 [Saprospiraceae bacterium]|jgi:hypothetical protein
MNNVLKFLSFFLMLTLLVFSCNKDDDQDNSCTTDPAVTVEENIIGTWTIDGETNETVTFNADGTGSSSEDAFHFSTTNDGKDYHNFGWSIENNTTVVVAYDYSPDMPVVPFIISEDYTVLLNNCDKIEMESGFGSMLELTK